MATEPVCVLCGSITHETKHYIYFYVGPIAILCFRTADNTPLPIGIPQ